MLDFGLAKASARDGADVNMSQSHALSEAAQRGVILGTAAYMSPEQAKGQEVDKRTDIWAFGCVLYEMLTARRPFPGETFSDTVAKILESEPDWSSLSRDTPPAMRRLLRRCLEKDARRRLQAIGDARVEIEELLSGESEETPAIVAPASAWKRLLPWAVTFVLLALSSGITIWITRSVVQDTASGVVRLTLDLPEGEDLQRFAMPLDISPDGRVLAYVSGGLLHIREMSGLDSNVIAEVRNAVGSPFFSPDGQWVGFFDQGQLKKVSVLGGAPETLADASSFPMGGSWGRDDMIYFTPTNISGIWRVPASDGEAEPVTRLNRDEGEVSHRWPQVLPGGETVLFTVWEGPGWDEQRIDVVSLETGDRHTVREGGTTGRYASTGHLLYCRASTLMAIPFDLESLNVIGSNPVPLAERVLYGEGAMYAVSESGVLVYIPVDSEFEQRRLVWVDRGGSVEPTGSPPGPYEDVAISPDGSEVAVTLSGPIWDIGIYNVGRQILEVLSTGDGSSQWPVWTHDGMRIAYRGTRQGFRNVYWKARDGSTEERQLTHGDTLQNPTSFSPDGNWMVFDHGGAFLLALDGSEEIRPLNNPPRGGFALFSPDGRWIAYSSRGQIELRSFPDLRQSFVVSVGGGFPVWSRDSTQLFYRQGNTMLAVNIASGPEPLSEPPQPLFEGSFYLWVGAGFDVAEDGRFLMIQAPEPEIVALNIVLNWSQELKERVPAP